jgi:YVTN family beta-propeller protein
VVVAVRVGIFPWGVAVTPDGSKVYVANQGSNNVAVIATATNTVTATIPVGVLPTAVGKFIQPLPSFAGTPGQPNCRGVSVSALAQKYGGLSAAAAAFGLAVQDMQNAIGKFCGG